MNILAELGPAARRVRRGWERTLAGARDYRFAGEQATHADQLRETETSLSLMASASPDDPDQLRMASDIEHGAENRLTVLLGKPRLTLEEKRERDSIQAALAARRRGFEPPPVVLVQREQSAPLGFLSGMGGAVGAFAGVRLWMILAAGWALTGGALAVQTALKERIEDQRDAARADVAEANRTVALYRQREREYAAALDKAEEDRDSAIETVQRERTIAQRARAESRRTARELEAARSERGQPIDWGLPVAGDGPTAPPATPSDTN